MSNDLYFAVAACYLMTVLFSGMLIYYCICRYEQLFHIQTRMTRKIKEIDIQKEKLRALCHFYKNQNDFRAIACALKKGDVHERNR